MVKVKICGITNAEDALHSAWSGCDALGFVFYKRSPRYIEPEAARKIIKELPQDIIKVGVFVNSREKTVKKIAKFCNLNILQFHGSESPEFCSRFKNYKIIKAFRIKGKAMPQELLLRYRPFAYLFDAFSASSAGGTGKRFDWKLMRRLDGLKRPVFLSGGLNAGNVRQAINSVKPEWIDVSTSLESRPGKKNHRKIKSFLKRAKGL